MLVKQGLSNGPFRFNMSDGSIEIATKKDDLDYGLSLKVFADEIQARIYFFDNAEIFTLVFDRSGNELYRACALP